MATKTIKVLLNGVIQEIEVEDIVSPKQPLSNDERIDVLEDKHDVIITEGNLLVGNGTTTLEEMTPEEVLSHINGASIKPITSDEYNQIEEFNSNTLYLITDAEEEGGNFDGYTKIEVDALLQDKSDVSHGHEIEDIDGLKTELDNIKADIDGLEVGGIKAAGTELGTVKSGGDVTIENGIITVVDSSHNHTIDNIIGFTDVLNTKADENHKHNISDVNNLQSALDSKVEREEINQIEENLESHTENNDIHMSPEDKTQLGESYTHATSAHAPSDAEKNIIVGIQRNGVDLTVDSSTRKVDIIVPTTAAEIGADEAGAASSALSSSKEYTNLQIDGLSSRLAFIDESNEDVTFNSSSTGINIDTSLSLTSTNPVQNRVVTKNLDSLSKEINVERKRINALSTLESGSTTGDRELIDARIDKDGYEHDNVGEHIRGITRQLDENIKENSISKTCAGNVIVLDDASNNGFEELTIFGHSEQASTTGKNLFDITQLLKADDWTESNGVYSGSIVSYRTAFHTSNGGFTTPTLFENTQYTLSFFGKCDDNTSTPRVYFLYTDGTLDEQDIMGTNFTKYTMVSAKGKTVSQIYGGYGKQNSVNLYLKDIQLEIGTEATEYEPYTGYKQSPSVEYPQPIESVGDDGSIDVEVYGGNLVNSKKIVKNRNESVNVSDDGYTITVVGGTTTNWSDSYIDIVEFPKLKGKKLYVSIDSVSATNVKATKVSFIVVSTTGKTNYSLQDGKKEVVIPYDVKDVYVSISTNYSEDKLSSQNEVVVKGLKVSLSDIPYETYKQPQSLIASIPNGLPSIPLGSTIPDSIKASKVHMDGVYWDENTQQYHIADTVSGSGKYVQRIKTLVFDGITNKMRSADANYSERYGMNYAWTQVLDKLVGGACMTSVGITPQIIGIEGWASSNNNYSMSLTLIDERTGVAVGDNKTTIADKFNVWLQANPVTISYVLATPIETDLSSEEIEAFKSLKTNKPVTTIINDTSARMEVSYYEDMKTYLDESYGQSVTYKEQILSDNQKQQARQNIGASKVITRTYSGNAIVATDSDDAKFEGLRVFGRSEQVVTTGKNLLENTATTKTGNGVTFTVNDNGSVTLNGTATKKIYFFLNSFVYPDNPVILSGTNCDINCFIYDDILKDYDYTGTGIEIADAKGKTGSIYIVVENGTSVNRTIYPMIRLASVTDATYEPYTSCKPSPSVEYPQPIESVGDDGSVNVGVYGKNLFDVEEFVRLVKNLGGYEQTVDNRRCIVFFNSDLYKKDFSSVFSNFKKNTQYTLSLSAKPMNASSVDKSLIVGIFKDNEDSLSSNIARYTQMTFANIGVTTFVNKSVTLPVGSTGKSIGFSYIDYTLWAIDLDSIQLEESPVQTEIDNAPKQSLAIQTPNGLPGIPLGETIPDAIASSEKYMRGVWWCEEEQQYYIGDTKEYGRGKYVQRIRERILDGSEAWTRFSQEDVLNQFYFYTEDSLHIAGVKSVLCTHYIADVIGNRYNNFGIIYAGAKDSTSKGDSICVNTLECWNDTASWKALLAERPITAQYILAEPIETDLSAEEIEAYKALTSNYPTTTILNDENAYMEVTMVADAKNYIQKERDDLRAEFDAKLTQILSLLPDNVQAAMIDNETNMLLESEM